MFIWIQRYYKNFSNNSLILITNCSVNNSNIVDKTPEAEDPWENLNRGTFAFNQKFDKYLLAPFS